MTQPIQPTRLGPIRRRRLHVISKRTQRRGLFLFGGLVVGSSAVAFALLCDEVSALFLRILAISPYLPLLLTPLGFAISNLLARRYFNFSQGSGIPQVIAAMSIHDKPAQQRLVALRVAIGKVLLTAFGLLCGASIGREGPTVQIGASVMYAVGRFAPRMQRGLLIAGASAGVAAAFNTPLAGIVFGIEELGRSFEWRNSSTVLGTVICGGLVSLSWLGDYNYFGTNEVVLHGSVWLAVPLCGCVGGLLGGVFGILMVRAAGPWQSQVGRWLKLNPVIFSALCGFGVAVCGLLSQAESYGTGYQHVLILLHGGQLPTAYFAPLKFTSTLLSAISGIPGGFFSPTLCVGASIGRTLHDMIALAPMPAMAILGMAAYFSGVVQAPLTAAVIVTEMTNDQGLVVPVLLAALLGHAASSMLMKEGVYHALARRYVAPAMAKP